MQNPASDTRHLTRIDKTILDAILNGRLPPGSRLVETKLATLFEVSRTLVREALLRLEARHIVGKLPHSGWVVEEPSEEDAVNVYATRRALESGFLRGLTSIQPEALATLHAHLEDERAAIAEDDKLRLTCLMGDFHILLAEISGNAVMIDLQRNLTARTILISILYQPGNRALLSHDGHCRIVDALERGDFRAAADMSVRHLDEVEAGLELTRPDPLGALRLSLALPVSGQPKSEMFP